MLRRRQINADPGGSKANRALAAAVGFLRSLAWGAEERLWDWGRRAARALEPAREPIARVAWAVEERVLWPLQDRAAERAPRVSGQAAGAVAVAALAVGVVALAVVSLQRDEEPSELRASKPAAVPVVPAPEPASKSTGGPVLRGAPPTFDVEGERGGTGGGQALAASAGLGAAGAEAGAGASSKPVPAGPAAMKVARRFADAFVDYEVGEREERAKQVFEETATPQLASALAERPPRQPATVDVPQAKVLNLVPGPRRGKAYTVSASLLRVGTTTELRLELRKKNGNWLITDVRG